MPPVPPRTSLAPREVAREATIGDGTWEVPASHHSRHQLLELICLAGVFRIPAGMLNSCRAPLDGPR